MKNKYALYLASITILLVGCISIGTSYSLWNSSHVQEHENIVNTGCFSLTYTETSDILLENSYPMNDDNGLKQIPYKFSVTNTCSIVSKMSVAINVKNSSTIDSSLIKSAIKASGDLKDTRLLSNYKSGDIASTDTTTLKSFVILTDSIGVNETKDYEVYLWLDDDASNDVQNKRFDAKVVVIDEATDIYTDSTGAPAPELYTGMIAVSYDDEGNTVVANTSKSWYDYEKHEWANAVLVDRANYAELPAGSIIPEDKILQYYVWIPRYRYLLWNAENGSSEPQAINIVFEDNKTPKSSGSHNGEWLTHPAFTFGDTELNGIWVGKFENSTSDEVCLNKIKHGGDNTSCEDRSLKIVIKPNWPSLIFSSISAQFYSVKSTNLQYGNVYGVSDLTTDIHIAKNIDWGAIAYLSSSVYGRYNDSFIYDSNLCVVSPNNVIYSANNLATLTGCSGLTSVTSSVCPDGYDWKSGGQSASTTNNQYGIFDMVGGTWEYVMANMGTLENTFNYGKSLFDFEIEKKYYDLYKYATINTAYQRGFLGDATRENATILDSVFGGWNGDYSNMINNSDVWLLRGGRVGDGYHNGIFAFYPSTGSAAHFMSSRSVLTAP